MHCLYCGEEFPNDQLWTRDQLQYMGRVVEHEVTPLIQKELNEMLRRAFSSLRSPLVAGERQDVRPEKKGGVMRLHGLLVYASFIGFWVAIIPSPSYAQSLAERYESTRRTDFHTAITQALVP